MNQSSLTHFATLTAHPLLKLEYPSIFLVMYISFAAVLTTNALVIFDYNQGSILLLMPRPCIKTHGSVLVAKKATWHTSV